MVRNDTLAEIDVVPRTFAVKVNGEQATTPPAVSLALTERYRFS
jgi:urease alpha subunit